MGRKATDGQTETTTIRNAAFKVEGGANQTWESLAQAFAARLVNFAAGQPARAAKYGSDSQTLAEQAYQCVPIPASLAGTKNITLADCKMQNIHTDPVVNSYLI